MAGNVLRLLYGADRRNPRRVLDLAGGEDDVYLQESGFAPGPGAEETIWSGRSGRRDGQRRISSSRDNAEYAIKLQLRGDSPARLGQVQREVQRFFHECGLYEERRQGEPVWLEYRWSDGLEDLPAPVFGQFSHYMRVLAGDVPAWPQSLHSPALWTDTHWGGIIRDVVANLVVEPYAEGLAQTAGNAIGQVEVGTQGVLMPVAVTNVVTNPSFGHATWDTGWAVSDSDLKARNETRAGFTRSLESAVRLVNLSASAQQFRQTLTLTAATYYISCTVRRADGEPVTSADLTLWGQGAGRTTTFVAVDGGPWYLAYAAFTGVAAASTHGVQVAAGREVVIDDVQCALSGTVDPKPFCAGWQIGCAWSGTAHASSSSRPDPQFKWTLTDKLLGEYTIAGWITTHWTNSGPAADLMVAQYYVDANNYVGVYFDFSADRFEVAGARDGVAFSGNGSAQTITLGQSIRLALVQDTSNLYLYVNGALDITVANALGMPPAGTLRLGNSNAGSQPVTAWLDGWRIWSMALSATQEAQLYDNELPVKNAYPTVPLGGGRIGTPPFLWTVGGDGVLSNHDDTGHNNWGVVGGISGDVAAGSEWHVAPDAGAGQVRGFWLNRLAVEEAAALTGATWMEFQGAGDAGCSGGEYGSVTLVGVDSDVLEATVARPDLIRGQVAVLARLQVSGANSLTITPYYEFGSAFRVYGESFVIAPGAGFVLRDLGTLDIDWGENQAAPNTLTVGLLAEQAVTGTTSLRLDFVELLPYPACKAQAVAATIDVAAGDELIVGERTAVMSDSAGQPKYRFEHRGEPVEVEPNRLNYVTLTHGENGVAFNIAAAATVGVIVTPRWLLPGGGGA